MINTISQLMGNTNKTISNWKKENRPIIALIYKYFSKRDLEEFLETGKIDRLEKLSLFYNFYGNIRDEVELKGSEVLGDYVVREIIPSFKKYLTEEDGYFNKPSKDKFIKFLDTYQMDEHEISFNSLNKYSWGDDDADNVSETYIKLQILQKINQLSDSELLLLVQFTETQEEFAARIEYFSNKK